MAWLHLQFSYVMFNLNSVLLSIDCNYTFWNMWHFLSRPQFWVLKTEKNDALIVKIVQQIKLQIFKISSEYCEFVCELCVRVDVRWFKWGRSACKSTY